MPKSLDNNVTVRVNQGPNGPDPDRTLTERALVDIPEGLKLTGVLVGFPWGTRARVAAGDRADGFTLVLLPDDARPWAHRSRKLIDDARLDLTDEISRMRALQWLAARVGLPLNGAYEDGEWHIALASAGLCWLNARDLPGGWNAWALRTWNNNHRAVFSPRHVTGWAVPALADLDPNDRTRLPDGTRLVDALALAAVVRHYQEHSDGPEVAR